MLRQWEKKLAMSYQVEPDHCLAKIDRGKLKTEITRLDGEIEEMKRHLSAIMKS